MRVVLGTKIVDYIKESPEKAELITYGTLYVGSLGVSMLDNGVDALFSMEIPRRRPQGRVVISKKAYSN